MNDTIMGVFLGLAILGSWHLYLIANDVRAIRRRLDEAAPKEHVRH